MRGTQFSVRFTLANDGVHKKLEGDYRVEALGLRKLSRVLVAPSLVSPMLNL